MIVLRHAILLGLLLSSICTLPGCAIRPYIFDNVADVLAKSGQSEEDDVILAREASAFYLKLSESVLREAPGNLKLAESVASGFTQYAYAFVSFEADQLQAKDAKGAQRMRERAARLYARGHMHAMAALEKTTPGFKNALAQQKPRSTLSLTQAQVGVAYWAAAAWGGMISMSKDDPEKVADLPLAIDLAKLAWEKKPDHGNGGLSTLMGTFEAASPGGSLGAADKYFDLAIEQSKGQSAGPWVAKAESIAIAKADQKDFEKWLRQAIRISDENRNLENEVMRARAVWLLDMMDDLF